MRYQVQRARDDNGNLHLHGPVVVLKTNDLGEARGESATRGGLVIDTQTTTVLMPDGSWLDLDQFNAIGNTAYRVQ